MLRSSRHYKQCCKIWSHIYWAFPKIELFWSLSFSGLSSSAFAFCSALRAAGDTGTAGPVVALRLANSASFLEITDMTPACIGKSQAVAYQFWHQEYQTNCWLVTATALCSAGMASEEASSTGKCALLPLPFHRIG